MKRLVTALITVLCAVMLISFSACNGIGTGVTQQDKAVNDGTSEAIEQSGTSNPADEYAKIIWYMRADSQRDFEVVMKKANEILKEKINAEIDMRFVEPASYNEKMKMVIASNEYYDICFTGAGYNDYYGNAAKGAFLPLNELLPKYAPKTYAQIHEDFWEAVRVGGNIYAVINYQIVGRQTGMYMLKEYQERYNFDLSKAAKFEDMEQFLKVIKENEPELYPMSSAKQPLYIIDGFYSMGIDEIGQRHSPGVVAVGDETLTVVNQYEMQSYIDRLHTVRDWYLKGYISKDAVTDMSSSAMLEGKVPVHYGNMKPGSEIEVRGSFGGREIVLQKFDNAFVNTSSISATLNAISYATRYPEKAMMVLEMANTDKEFYNTLCFGIEGVHYNKIGENEIELVQNSGYYPNKAWAMGCQFNAYVIKGQPLDIWERTIELNETAERSKLLGFVFDPSSVSTEIAQCNAVIEEYGPGLWTGSLDPDVYLPQLVEKLKAAGSEKIIAEKQRQINEWVAKKSK